MGCPVVISENQIPRPEDIQTIYDFFKHEISPYLAILRHESVFETPSGIIDSDGNFTLIHNRSKNSIDALEQIEEIKKAYIEKYAPFIDF